MTNEQIRITIAEKLGWQYKDHEEPSFKDPSLMVKNKRWYDPQGRLLARTPPDYPNDLNACHEFEKPLHGDTSLANHYAEFLKVVVYKTKHSGTAIDFQFASATALQRCEAFLRLHGLWIDEPTPAPKVEGA